MPPNAKACQRLKGLSSHYYRLSHSGPLKKLQIARDAPGKLIVLTDSTIAGNRRADGLYHFRTIIPHWYEVFGIRRAAHIHFRIRHPEQGDLTTLMYFQTDDEEDVRKEDFVFQGDMQRYGERLLIPKEAPGAYSDLGLKLESEAVCCKFDLAFL